MRGALISLSSLWTPPIPTPLQPSRRRTLAPSHPYEGQVMASGVWAGAEGRQGGALSRGGGRGRGESPSWAVWRPFTHIPEGRGQGGGPGASGQWTGIQAQGCHTVEIGDAGPGAPEVPLTLLFLSSLLSGSIPVCLSLCTFVFLWGCLSLHLPLSSLLPLPSLAFLYVPWGAAPLEEPDSQDGRWLCPGRSLA